MININQRPINQTRTLTMRKIYTQIRHLINITQRRASRLHKLAHFLIPFPVNTTMKSIADIRLPCAHNQGVATDTLVRVE